MNRKKIVGIFLGCLFPFLSSESGYAMESEAEDEVKTKKPSFISLDTKGGWVFPTNDFVSGKNKIPYYSSISLKYGRCSDGDSWEDKAYGMPYYGIGFYSGNFFKKKDLGLPFALYLFQGATIRRFNPKWALNYEWNLGMSFNWVPYDPFDNPNNVALGSSVNVYVAGSMYMKYYINEAFDLNMGVSLTHFSNGAYRLPNKGLNLVAPYLELVYNINRPKPSVLPESEMAPPEIEKHIVHDVMFTITSRQIRFDTTGTGLPSRYIDRQFKVFGLSYAPMIVNSYKYRWGPSFELVYDESSDARAWREKHPVDGMYYDRVELGDVWKRFSCGVSLKGEVTMPRLSIFANFGYNLLHGNEYDYRFYQIMGVKAYLKENLFGTFGIRASRFSKAQYLYWSLGYSFDGKPLKKKRSKN